LPPLPQPKRQRKIPPLSNTEVKNAIEVSIVEEVMVNGAGIEEIAAIVVAVVVESQERTMTDSQLKLERSPSQEEEVATVETEAAKGATEAMREVNTAVAIAMEPVEASAQERREQLNLPSLRISNEKFEKKVWDLI